MTDYSARKHTFDRAEQSAGYEIKSTTILKAHSGRCKIYTLPSYQALSSQEGLDAFNF